MSSRPVPGSTRDFGLQLSRCTRLAPHERPQGTALGSGQSGSVYQTRKAGEVLKITDDRAEALAGLAMRKLALRLPGIVSIRRVLELEYPPHESKYGLWRDEVDPVASYPPAGDDLLVDLGAEIYVASQELGEYPPELLGLLRTIPKKVPALGPMLRSLKKLMDNGVFLHDLRRENVGDRDGVATLFDVGGGWVSDYWEEFPLERLKLSGGTATGG
jgi:hypothetical protein